MMDERSLIQIVMNTTQEQCEEIGRSFLQWAKSPRTPEWKAAWRRRLDELPKSPLSEEIERARLRVLEGASK